MKGNDDFGQNKNMDVMSYDAEWNARRIAARWFDLEKVWEINEDFLRKLDS